MNLIAAIIFTVLAIAIGLLSSMGKIALAVSNPLTAGIAFLGCAVAAISFFVRYSKANSPTVRSGTDKPSMFWTWVSRIASVVGLAAGLLSFGRQLFELITGTG